MKKNRPKEESSSDTADQRPEKSSGENILVFLVLALVLLAASVFSGPHQFLPQNTPPAQPEITEKYVWVPGSPKMHEGLYLFTPEQLKNILPGIDLLQAHTAAQEANDVVYALQADAAIPQPVRLPPAVANIFFQPIPINRADKDILTSLPGIGPVLAERIVQRRNQHGLFRSKDELLQVTGIGPKKFAALVDHITLD
jgi:competence ComEA-like helix-hairpin-helix protein